jgi:chromosome segregation ATPase
MIESREDKLKKFKKKDSSLFYNVIHTMINKNNKKNEDLSKKGGEMRDKLIGSDEKIFELSQKICKLKDKNNKFLTQIEIYKTRIAEMEFEINYLKNERDKKQKDELEQENQKNKDESEINSLLSVKKELEQRYVIKLDLKLEEYDIKREKENLFREEKKYKLKNEVYEAKLEHCKKKNEELNNKIEEYEKERDNLLEKSKIPRKNKIRIEELENELKKLIEEIEGYEKKCNIKSNNNKIKEEKNKK